MSFEVRREGFASLGEEWRALCDSCVTRSIFATPDWLSAWWESCAGAQELHLLSFREDGALRGVAPLMLHGDALAFVGASDVCDNHDFPVTEGARTRFFPALLEEIEPLGWRRVELDGLWEGSPALELFTQAAEERGFQVERSFDEVSRCCILPATWEDYLQSLRKKDRHELRRKLRRLQGAGEVALLRLLGIRASRGRASRVPGAVAH